MKRQLIEALEKRLGFRNPYSFREGPCAECGDLTLTYYLPDLDEWHCPECIYSELPILG